MLQAIPLTPALCVDVDLIIQRSEAQWRQIDHGMTELLAAEAGKLDIVEGPIELHALAFDDFLARRLDELGSQQVQS